MTLRQTLASRFQLKEEPTIGGLDLGVYRPAADAGLFGQAGACGWAVNENALSATKSTGLIQDGEIRRTKEITTSRRNCGSGILGTGAAKMNSGTVCRFPPA